VWVTEDRVRVRLRIGSRIGHEEQFSAMVISGGGAHVRVVGEGK